MFDFDEEYDYDSDGCESHDSLDEKRSIMSTLALLETPEKRTETKSATYSQSSQQRKPYESPDRKASRQPSNKWTPRKINLLCNMWEEEPALYDSKHRDYHNKTLRTDAIEKFSAVLNMDSKYKKFKFK